MTEISSYTNYLPPVLWLRDNDPTQFLGRTLRIFEKILTGIPIDTYVTRASAVFVRASGKQIVLRNLEDASKFRPRDFLTIDTGEQTAKRVEISRITGAEILLVNELATEYKIGIVRIAELEPGQTRFRLQNSANLGRGIPIKISQGVTSEIVTIERVEDDFVELSTGLTNTYTMTDTSVSVKVQDGLPLITRSSAEFANASGNRIVLKNIVDADRFRPGEYLTIEGTTERVKISSIAGAEIWLDDPLTKIYTVGNIHSDRQYASLRETIGNLYQLFNPWRTPAANLPWLASWVALTLQKDWSEYQSRKLISQMFSVYRQRGLKQGLQTYLDIYAVTDARPRIAIDDGEAIFRATFVEDGTAYLRAVAHSQTIALPPGTDGEERQISVLLHPTGLAVDSDNKYIVADEGNVALKPPRPPALWRISSTGEVDYDATDQRPIPEPHPLISGGVLKNPRAVVIDSSDRYSVVDIGPIGSKAAAIYRLEPEDDHSSVNTVISAPRFPAVYPVDMILDNSENFIVLDRGGTLSGDPPEGPSDPQILIVDNEGVFRSPEHKLKMVEEPTAIVMDNKRRFIVADAKNQKRMDPADLVRIDPEDDWSEESLLLNVENPANPNPLVFPTGLAFESPEVLLVCDTGLRLGYDANDPEGSDSAYRYLAEPATIYRVDLSPLSQKKPAKITRVTSDRQMVNPTKMTFDRQGKLIIADKGESKRSSPPERDWRAKSNEFGVVVHFSRQRLTTFSKRNQIRRAINNVIEEQKPVHSYGWMDT